MQRLDFKGTRGEARGRGDEVIRIIPARKADRDEIEQYQWWQR